MAQQNPDIAGPYEGWTGKKVLITAENISCPASAAAFGLKPLPEMLAPGKMLFNMGLFD